MPVGTDSLPDPLGSERGPLEDQLVRSTPETPAMSAAVSERAASPAMRAGSSRVVLDRRTAPDRVGLLVLLLTYVTMLSGRFTLDRVGAALPPIELRLVGTYAVLMAFLPWWAAGRGASTKGGRVPVLALVLLGLYLAISGSWSPPGSRVLDGLLDFAVMAVLLFVTGVAASRLAPTSLIALWWWVYATGVAYLAAALLAGPGEQGRYAAFGGGPNVFVRVMGLGALAAIALAVLRHRSGTLWSLPLFLFGAFLSGSRGGLLALSLIALLGLQPVLRRLARRHRVAVLLSLGAGTAAVTLFAPVDIRATLSARYIDQTIGQRYDSSRLEILGQAWRLFGDNLWVGSGLDGYYGVFGRFASFEYPHNLLVAVGAEGGLIGVTLLLATLGAYTRALWTARPLPPLSLFAALAASFILGASMFSGDYYDARFLWFFAIISAATAAPAAEAKAAEATATWQGAQKRPAGSHRRVDTIAPPAFQPGRQAVSRPQLSGSLRAEGALLSTGALDGPPVRRDRRRLTTPARHTRP